MMMSPSEFNISTQTLAIEIGNKVSVSTSVPSVDTEIKTSSIESSFPVSSIEAQIAGSSVSYTRPPQSEYPANKILNETINHGRGYYPSITVIRSDGQVVECEIKHLSKNTVYIASNHAHDAIIIIS